MTAILKIEQPSPNCDWCDQEENIHHVFFECFRHHSIRTQLQSSLRSLEVAFTEENLLGGGQFTKCYCLFPGGGSGSQSARKNFVRSANR